jgi:hypothetical protein
MRERSLAPLLVRLGLLLGWMLGAPPSPARADPPPAAPAAPPSAPPALPPGHPRLTPLDTSREVRYFLDQPPAVGHHAGDLWLAKAALQAWARASGGSLKLVESTRDQARLHLYWVTGRDSLYGEMRPILVNGQPGAAVLVRPVTEGLGPGIAERAAVDPLFRDTVVYLTCLHELGHAFGMPHTADFRDIMYSFQYGGDIPAFFARYRNQLQRREDIARVSGLSAGDVARLRGILGQQRGP